MINPSKLNMLIPQYNIDNIIGVFSGSLLVGAPTAINSVTTATATVPTSFNDTCYVQGIFSFDGGTTWNDFGADVPNLSVPGFPVFQTCECTGYTQGNNLVICGSSFYNFATSTGTAYTILYKVALVAKNDQGKIQPLPTNEKLQFNSALNYQKIFMSGSPNYDLISGSGKTVSVIHGLGYVPRVRAYFQETSGGLRMLPPNWRFFPDAVQLYISVQVTEQTLTFYTDPDLSVSTINGNIQYRIYLES